MPIPRLGQWRIVGPVDRDIADLTLLLEQSTMKGELFDREMNEQRLVPAKACDPAAVAWLE